jgi:translation initiation factor IF-3
MSKPPFSNSQGTTKRHGDKQNHQHRINHHIKSPTVRVVHGEQNKVLSTKDAILLASSHQLDLIEVSPLTNPPVCKICDYGKFLYELEKNKTKEKNSKPTKIKELQFHTNTAEHDFQTKIRHAIDFLQENHPVTVKLQFRGRENAHKELGIQLLNKIQESLKEHGHGEGQPKIQGKNAFLRILPGKEKQNKQKSEQTTPSPTPSPVHHSTSTSPSPSPSPKYTQMDGPTL